MHPRSNQGNLRIRGAGCVLAAALLLLPLLAARGQGSRSDTLSALHQETRKDDDTTDHLSLVQWYPAEFMRRSMDGNPRTPPE